MSDEPLTVSSSELRAAADTIDEHARVFVSEHQASYGLAGGVSLGSGTAATALGGMLTAWEKNGAVFGTHFARHSEKHRAAADRYGSTDEHGAQDISRWV